MKNDDLPTLAEDAEIGRVEVYKVRTHYATIRCPDITFNKKVPMRDTMSREQCLLRVYTQAACAKKCKIGRNLLEEWKKQR